jgi:hypothetical protein
MIKLLISFFLLLVYVLRIFVCTKGCLSNSGLKCDWFKIGHGAYGLDLQSKEADFWGTWKRFVGGIW